MHDALGVRRGECLGHLNREVEDLVDWHATGLEPGPEGHPLQELADEIRYPLEDASVVDRHDSRMVQGGGRARLLLEAAEIVVVGRKGRGQHLDRHRAGQLRVVRTIDAAHAAGAQQPEDLVAANPRRQDPGSSGGAARNRHATRIDRLFLVLAHQRAGPLDPAQTQQQ